MEQNHKQDIKLKEIETDLVWIKNEITNIQVNHLKHIYQKIEDINVKLLWGFLAVIAASVLLKILV